MSDTECEDSFRMNMDKHWSLFYQKLIENNKTRFCINTNIFHIMQTVLIHLFGYSMFSFRKLTFDELKAVLEECHLPILLILCNIHSESQKHIIRVFPSDEGDENSHIVDGTCSKYITVPFISGGLNWLCSSCCKFLHAHEFSAHV